jgi:hypothetical protein
LTPDTWGIISTELNEMMVPITYQRRLYSVLGKVPKTYSVPFYLDVEE